MTYIIIKTPNKNIIKIFEDKMNKPNVLLITVDQMRIFEMGCYTKEKILKNMHLTPNINALAKKSVQFNNAFTPNPVCTPARSCILSGQYSRRCIGSVGNACEELTDRKRFPDITLAEKFKTEGYDTAIIGKWHIHDNPYSLGFNNAIYTSIHHKNKQQTFYTNKTKNIIEGNNYEYELNQTQKFLKEHKDKPFFLFHNISLPHMPYFDIDEQYLKKFVDNPPPFRKNVEIPKDKDFLINWFKIYYYDYLYYMHKGKEYENLPEGFDLKTLYAMYCGAITAADMQVGRILQTIKELSLEKNTIITFVSDHGDNMGSHALFNKDVSYEESIHIPFLILCPDAVPFKCNDLVTLLDITPTLFELCNFNYSNCYDGISLKDLIYKKIKLKRNKIFFETPQGEIGCRTKRFLYSAKITLKDYVGNNLPPKIPCFRFFDLKNDPYQLNNLAEAKLLNPYIEKKKTELNKAVNNWHATTPWFKPNI